LKYVLKIFKDIMSYKNMVDKYSAQDILLIATLTNLHTGTCKGVKIVDLLIQRDSYGFFNIYSTRLRKTKNFSISFDFLVEMSISSKSGGTN